MLNNENNTNVREIDDDFTKKNCTISDDALYAVIKKSAKRPKKIHETADADEPIYEEVENLRPVSIIGTPVDIEQKFNFGDNDNPEPDEIEKNDIVRVQENSNELSKNVSNNLSHPPNDEIVTSVSGGKKKSKKKKKKRIIHENGEIAADDVENINPKETINILENEKVSNHDDHTKIIGSDGKEKKKKKNKKSTKKEMIENNIETNKEKPVDYNLNSTKSAISHDKNEKQEIEKTQKFHEIDADQGTKVLKTKPRPINPLALIESKEKEEQRIADNSKEMLNSEKINEKTSGMKNQFDEHNHQKSFVKPKPINPLSLIESKQEEEKVEKELVEKYQKKPNSGDESNEDVTSVSGNSNNFSVEMKLTHSDQDEEDRQSEKTMEPKIETVEVETDHISNKSGTRNEDHRKPGIFVKKDVKKPAVKPRRPKSSEEKKPAPIDLDPDEEDHQTKPKKNLEEKQSIEIQNSDSEFEKSKQTKNPQASTTVMNPRALNNNRMVKSIDPEPVISGNGTSSQTSTTDISTSKKKSSNDHQIMPNFRMAPASTANVPGIDNKKSGKIQTQTSIISRESNDEDDDEDVLVIQDLSLFSDKPKKLVKPKKLMKPKLNPGYLTPQEIQILEEARKAKEDEAKKLELMEEKKRKDLNEIRIQRKAEENARLAKTRELKIEKDVRAKAIKKSLEAPRPTTEDLRHGISVSQMTGNYVFTI